MYDETYPILIPIGVALFVGLAIYACCLAIDTRRIAEKTSTDIAALRTSIAAVFEKMNFTQWLDENPQQFSRGDRVGKYLVIGVDVVKSDSGWSRKYSAIDLSPEALANVSMTEKELVSYEDELKIKKK